MPETVLESPPPIENRYKYKVRFTDGFAHRLASRITKDSENGCWLWTGCCNRKGYGEIRICDKVVRVHRVMYEIFVGGIDDSQFVCHACDNPKCVNPTHLFLGTNADNLKDAAIKGRLDRKLDIGDVEAIRCLSGEGYSQSKIGRMFSVSQPYIGKVLRGEKRVYV